LLRYVGTQLTIDGILFYLERVKQLIRTDHMVERHKKKILDICSSFKEFLYFGVNKLTCTGLATMNVRPYRIPKAQKK